MLFDMRAFLQYLWKYHFGENYCYEASICFVENLPEDYVDFAHYAEENVGKIELIGIFAEYLAEQSDVCS